MGIAMKFVLIWTVAAMTAQGPAAIASKEKQAFADRPACETFARNHAPRMADWTRGLLHLDWSDPVQVTHRCALAGQPI